MIPRRYAPSTLAGLRSAQNATGLSLASAAISNESQSGKCLTGISGPARDLAPPQAAGPAAVPGRLRYPVAISRAMLGSMSRPSMGGKATPLPLSA